jgi:hypothetical protein
VGPLKKPSVSTRQRQAPSSIALERIQYWPESLGSDFFDRPRVRYFSPSHLAFSPVSGPPVVPPLHFQRCCVKVSYGIIMARRVERCKEEALRTTSRREAGFVKREAAKCVTPGSYLVSPRSYLVCRSAPLPPPVGLPSKEALHARGVARRKPEPRPTVFTHTK